MTYSIHPFAEIFPQMLPDEWEAFVADIDKNGVMVPLTLFQGKILDGRHRYQAVETLATTKQKEIPFQTTEFQGTRTQALHYVYSANLHRRHLTIGQRSGFGVLIKEELQKEIKPGAPANNRNASKNNSAKNGLIDSKTNPQTRDMAAKAVGVGKSSITQMEKIKDEAPDLFKDVMDGEKSLFEGAKELKKRQAKAKQQEMIAAAEEKELPDTTVLHVGDFRRMGAMIEDNSVHFIFTDPPYDKDSANLYAELAEFGARVLLPGGLCMAYTGQMHLPEVLTGMRQYLDYVWTCAITHSGEDLRFMKWNLFNGWKPVVLFAKPPVTAWWEWVRDVASGGREKDGHEWQQAESEAAHFIEKFCPPNGIVCDPFCGSGTTLAAAAKLGRRGIGIDEDEDDIAYTRKRVIECQPQ